MNGRTSSRKIKAGFGTFITRLLEKSAITVPKYVLGKAIAYTFAHWDRLV